MEMSNFFRGGKERPIVPIVKYRDAVPRIRWSSYPPWEEAVLRENGMFQHLRRHSAVSCAKTAEPIEMSFGLWTRVGSRKRVLHGMCTLATHSEYD